MLGCIKKDSTLWIKKMEVNMRLKGKSVVITGATGGIGSETAKVFKSNGAKLALLGRDKKNWMNCKPT